MPEPRPIADGLFRVTPEGPRLLAGRCDGCGKLHFPASDSCPYCGGASCHETALAGTGQLFLYTVVKSAPPGYRGPLPYGFGVVELREGLRVVTRLTEPDAARLWRGQAMRLVIEPLFTDDDGTPVLSYAFAPGAPA
ncbi:MAG TPA: OB-fold domain-containing protein [Candidatus Eisenbacteria bacterium]|nr:OB-fold domain-containing protein [Candidatus Eisenbacteria bacterium]